MGERSTFHTPGGHEHDQSTHGGDGGGDGKEISGGGESSGWKNNDLTGRVAEDPISSRSKDERYANASAARAGRQKIYDSLTEKSFKLIDSNPQGGDVYRLRTDSGFEKVRVEPTYGTGSRDAHGRELHITHDKFDYAPDGEAKAVALKLKFSSDNFARLEGAEIFATGTWNGKTFADADLDEIIRSFEFFNLSGKVPLKLGHNTEQPLTDGQPALGWVDRVWREGGKLKADFRDVPEIMYEAIKNGRYKNVSVELLRDVLAGTQTVPLVLDAVALLGADLPAVGSLKDLQALTMTRLQGAERLMFTQAFSFNTPTGGHAKMADEDTKVTEELAKLRAEKARMERDLDALKAQASAATENFSKLQGETRAKEVAEKRTWIVSALEDAVRDKRILPAARERFVRQFRIETDDEAVMRMPKTDVEQYIKENPNPYIKPASGSLDGNPDAVPVGGLPDVEMFSRSRQACRTWNKDPKHWENLVEAAKAVMKSDPLLAERYRALPDDHADGMYSA